MATSGLEVRFREGGERAEVTRFTRTLDDVIHALREIDRVYLMRGSRASWVVADLSHEADEMIVRVEARSSPKTRPAEDMLVSVDAFVGGAQRLSEVAEVPPLYMPGTVTRLARIAAPTHGIQEVSVATYNGTRGDVVPLSETVRQHAEAAVRSDDVAYGSVAGVLDIVNARRGSRVLRVGIYDVETRRGVSGVVQADLEEELRSVWRHRVLAGGRITRNARGQAVKIEIDRLERLPEHDTDRPRTEQLLGVAPDWLGGRDVDDYLMEVRGA